MDAFSKVEAVYEKFGADEPFYAVLTSNEYKGNNLDIEQFFRTGEELIDRQLQAIADRQIAFDRTRALDFGCGVGRLTNALGRHFDKVVGVDISTTMIDNAVKQRKSENCEFVVNKRQDLRAFDDGYFSFIYSDITLQHIPSPASENYIRDFMRILSPGGLAVFLVPDGPMLSAGSLGGRLNKFYRERFRPFYKRIRGKHEVQIHPLARQRVEQLVSESGGEVLRVEPHPNWAGRTKKYKPLYYWTTKKKAVSDLSKDAA